MTCQQKFKEICIGELDLSIQHYHLEQLCVCKDLDVDVDRECALKQLKAYIHNFKIILEIEDSIYKYTLLYIEQKNIKKKYHDSIYKHKLFNLCKNLDINDASVNNDYLLNAILTGQVNPNIVAFLTPQQLFPKKWENIIKKQMRENDAMLSVETTDEYVCPKCTERKCTVDTVQLRSADEPANKIVTCIVCGYTLIL